MEIFRKPSFADSTGDAIPFYHDGIYHIFSLTPPTGIPIIMVVTSSLLPSLMEPMV